jgi:hypothetical protein
VQPTIIVYEDGVVPPRVGNRVTLERPAAQPIWAGTGGRGIDVRYPTPDTDRGHTPIIELKLSSNSAIPLSFDSAGRLRAGPAPSSETALVVNAAQPKQGGISVSQGGTNGHAVTLAVAPSTTDGTSRVYVGSDGGLAVDPPTPWTWRVTNMGGNSRKIELVNGLTGAAINLGTA